MRERRSREEVEQDFEATAEQLAGAWGMCGGGGALRFKTVGSGCGLTYGISKCVYTYIQCDGVAWQEQR